jgi:hypothetical protein
MLVGSVAWAQQGLILEPWRTAPQPAAAPIPQLRAMPASGLGEVSSASSRTRKVVVQPSAPAAASSLRWSPPVVELLVDPWAKRHVAAPSGSRWVVPHSIEIVDPWAEAPAAKPRVASQRTPPHSTIF